MSMTSSTVRGKTTLPKPSALSTALGLLDRGFWPVAIHPPGIKLGRHITKGKEPIGEAWGTEQWTAKKIRDVFRQHPKAGVGIGLGPSRGPDGKPLMDVEGDGPRAAESLAILLGGELITTMALTQHSCYGGQSSEPKAVELGR